MATLKLILRRILEHRARRLIVITVTLAILVGGGGLAADNYFGLRSEADQLQADLAAAIEEAGRLSDLQLQHAETRMQLAAHTQRAVDDESIDVVRDEIVMLILDSKCKFRRVEINDPQTRSFNLGDNPLEDQGAGGEDELMMAQGSGYDLRLQEAAVEVTGDLENIKTLLARFHAMERLVHVSGLQLTQEATTREIQLRANLVFFRLQEAKAVEGDGLLPPPPPGAEAPEPPTGA